MKKSKLKTFLKSFLRLVGSRMTYLLVSLSFSVIIAVNAAITINSTNVSSGETLTVSRWNTMVDDLNNLNNDSVLECVTRTGNINSCNGDACYGSAFRLL